MNGENIDAMSRCDIFRWRTSSTEGFRCGNIRGMILPTSFSRESRPPRPSATRSSVLLLKGSVRVRGGVLGSSRADSRLLSAARGGSREVRICSWRRRASSA